MSKRRRGERENRLGGQSRVRVTVGGEATKKRSVESQRGLACPAGFNEVVIFVFQWDAGVLGYCTLTLV